MCKSTSIGADFHAPDNILEPLDLKAPMPADRPDGNDTPPADCADELPDDNMSDASEPILAEPLNAHIWRLTDADIAEIAARLIALSPMPDEPSRPEE
jgi:hypothetical protein